MSIVKLKSVKLLFSTDNGTCVPYQYEHKVRLTDYTRDREKMFHIGDFNSYNLHAVWGRINSKDYSVINKYVQSFLSVLQMFEFYKKIYEVINNAYK